MLLKLQWNLYRCWWRLNHSPTTPCCSFHFPEFNFIHLNILGYLGQPAQLDVKALKELHLLNVEPEEAVRGLLHEEKVDKVGHSDLVKIWEVDDSRELAAKGPIEGTPEAKQLAVSSHLIISIVIMKNI